MVSVILVRGPAGCGKSNHVAELREEYRDTTFNVCSADDFFLVSKRAVDGYIEPSEYKFEPSKLAQAHNRCLVRYLELILRPRRQIIVVDNTFIHLWEMEPYILAADRAQADVNIHEFHIKTLNELRKVAARNVHNVPPEVVWKMAVEFEPAPKAIVIPLKGL